VARNNSIFPNLELVMVRAKITQNQLAQIVNVTPSTLSLKLTGKSKLSLEECLAIRDALTTELPIEILFATELRSEILEK